VQEGTIGHTLGAGTRIVQVVIIQGCRVRLLDREIDDSVMDSCHDRAKDSEAGQEEDEVVERASGHKVSRENYRSRR
jgi:hypothetical protein